MAAGEAVPPGPDGFAGDLFLALAKDGRLVLDPGHAELVVAELEGTLDVVRDRLRMIAIRPPVDHPAAAQRAVDALFSEQIAPGQMERALRELPKYIQAFRIAGRLP
jgi:2-keto-3-deoxy-L-rhamnonate aldolase RhmA